MWKAASISGLALCALAAMLLHMTPATSAAMRIEQGQTCEAKAQRRGCNSQCGNGVVDAGQGEQCDDAGPTPACDADCTFVACGDGTVNAAAGEQCDDNNNISGDGCQADCMAGTICPCFTFANVSTWVADCRALTVAHQLICMDAETVGARSTFMQCDDVSVKPFVTSVIYAENSPVLACIYQDAVTGADLLVTGPASSAEAIACRDLIKAKQAEAGVCDFGP